jgi:hypothetical protein
MDGHDTSLLDRPITAKRTTRRGGATPEPENGAAQGDAVKAAAAAGKTQRIAIEAPKFQTVALTIRGIVPYVQHRFSRKAQSIMEEKQRAGSVANKGKARKAKDFDALYEEAMYRDNKGNHGIPASAFRNALISACRTVGFKMTIAKMSLFCEADAFDEADGTPLVLIRKGKPEKHMGAVRLATGVADISCRPLWRPGWEAVVRLSFDSDQFSPTDVVNLLHRAGRQVGVGEGRPDSKDSAGCGWGQFEIINL